LRRSITFLSHRTISLMHLLGVCTPFTHLNLLTKFVGKEHATILDVGCGQGGMMKLVRRKGCFSIGMDVFLPYLKDCKRTRSHDELVLGDSRFLPFRRKSFHLVFCIHVIEHLTKSEGLRLIKEMGEIAQRGVIIGAPVGDLPQELHFDNNPFQVHKSTWAPSELRAIGYRVIGHGIFALEKAYSKFFGHFIGVGSMGDRPDTPFDILNAVVNILTFFLRPLSYFHPESGSNMICYKKLAEKVL